MRLLARDVSTQGNRFFVCFCNAYPKAPLHFSMRALLAVASSVAEHAVLCCSKANGEVSIKVKTTKQKQAIMLAERTAKQKEKRAAK